MQVMMFLIENLILPILAGVAVYLICKWIESRLG